MEPLEFKHRFVVCVRANPLFVEHPDLVMRLSEFISFDVDVLAEFGVHPQDARFLALAGLPRQSAPFLDFVSHSADESHKLYDVYDMPATLFPLGGNGSGDPLGIELSSRAVVYLNHDDDMRRVFINSNISKFAEALCLYQEAQVGGTMNFLLERLAGIDLECIQPGAMWRMEIDSDLSDNEG